MAERRRPPWSRGVGTFFYAVVVSGKLSVGSARRNEIVCRGLPSGRIESNRISKNHRPSTPPPAKFT